MDLDFKVKASIDLIICIFGIMGYTLIDFPFVPAEHRETVGCLVLALLMLFGIFSAQYKGFSCFCCMPLFCQSSWMKRAKGDPQTNNKLSNIGPACIDIVVLDGSTTRKYSALPSIDTHEYTPMMKY